ncbi:LysE family transporter [uncultured Clostridium sp.]|jgi:threonine/homoserine/homoserine lactone efflux protein|uniref:LysE family translocator n=1 Tax=uncultured Clostridium sp. TaxID=59620 RepID=UPI002627D502|nr:LysE family transporter [uncultured Clostridium sp.]
MFILKAIAIGSLTGLGASIPLGPAGMESVKRAIDKGFWGGFQISIGAILADYLYIFLIHFGLDKILDLNNNVEGMFWVVSGCILFIFNRLSKTNSENQKSKVNKGKVPGWINGFLITFLNPSTPSVWIALSGTIMSVWISNGPKFYFAALSSMLITTILWFIMLNLLASRGLKKIAGENVTANASSVIYWVLYLLSIGFVFFGLFKILE